MSLHNPSVSSNQNLSIVAIARRPRRADSCGPCRTRHTKCDGVTPCTACSKASKKLRGPCEYSGRSGDTTSHDNEPKSHGLGLMMASSERGMHKRLSLYQAAEDFINACSAKGRIGQQIDRMQELCPDLGVHSGKVTIHTLPTSTRTSTNISRALSPIAAEQSAIHHASEQHSVREKLTTLETYLGSNIEQNMDEGRLARAWGSVATAMRELESIYLQYGMVISETDELENSMRIMCLKLVDWECVLSFLMGGSSSLLSWSNGGFSSTIIEQGKLDSLFAAKIRLHCEIQTVISVDMSHKEGLCKVLQEISNLKALPPISEMAKLAVPITGQDSLQKQELRFFANLLCMTLNCRAGLITRFYEVNKRYARSASLANILKYEALKDSRLKAQAIKHAGFVLDQFEALHQLDPRGTAKHCLRIYGVLIAVVVVAVAQLTRKRNGKGPDKVQVSRIHDRFESMRSQTDSHPLLDKGIVVLQEYLASGESARPQTAAKRPVTASHKRKKRSSSPRKEPPAARNSTLGPGASTRAYSTEAFDDDEEMLRDPVLPIAGKRQRVAPDTPITEPKMESVESEWENSASFSTTREVAPQEHSDLSFYTSSTNMDPASSFTPSTSAMDAQSAMPDYYTPHSSYDLWPDHPPLEVCRTPHTMWPGGYSSCNQTQDRFQAHSLTNDSEYQMRGQRYIPQAAEMIYAPPTPAPNHDSFEQHNTGSMDQTVALYTPSSTTSFPSTIQFNMGQTTGMEAPSWAIQAYQQGLGEDQATRAGAFWAGTGIQGRRMRNAGAWQDAPTS